MLARITAKTQTQKKIVSKLFESMGYSAYSFETYGHDFYQVGEIKNVYQGCGGGQNNSGKLFAFNELDQFIDYITTPQDKEIKLNDEYTAIVFKDGTVKVKCQNFTIEDIKKVMAAYNELNNIE